MTKTSQAEKPSANGPRPSATASFAAIHRYMATKEKNPHFRGPDGLARCFLPAWGRFLLKFPFIHGKMRRKIPGVYEYVSARTWYFDSVFRVALRDNIPQIVFLGAGYDTRSLRFSDLIQQTEIFELDAPPVQELKKACIQKHRLSVPKHLTFAPITFGLQDLGQALHQAGYDKSSRTLFLWEGVTYYLDEQTVRDTLAFIRHNSGPGSEVAFDYFLGSVIRGECDSPGARQARDSCAKRGEPYLFGIEEGDIQGFLAENGFELLSHHTAEDLEKLYLVDASSGQLLGRVFDFGCQAHARALPPTAV